MRGSRPWPGMITKPGKHGLKPNPEKPLVYFYGTRNVAFISTKDLQDFTKEKKDYLLKKRDRFKDPDFVRAIDEIVQDFISCWWRALTTIILAVLPVAKSFGFVTASAPFSVRLSDRPSRRTPGVKVHICAIVESALRDLVSDELQKIKQSTADDSQMISASKTYDAIWEYDGLHMDSYSSASESEELLLEMERLLYEDLREDLTRRGKNRSLQLVLFVF